jgi:hypothetical protein
MNKLQQLIIESVNEYMKAIEAAGEMAGHKSKMEAAKEAIEKRDITKTLNKLEEEEKMMIDEKKVKEMANEKKALEKYLAKLQKQLDKLESKINKGEKVEDTEEKEIVDETMMDENDPQLEESNKKMNESNKSEEFLNNMINMSIPEDSEEGEKIQGVWNSEDADELEFKKAYDYIKSKGGTITIEGNPDVTYTALENGDINYELTVTLDESLNESFLHMQKLAGTISESEYKAKIEEVSKKKPSTGLTKKEKSEVAKKARAGKDIGKKGKGFEDVAKAAGGGEKGKKIAAAAMWKGEAKKAKSLKEEVLALFKGE